MQMENELHLCYKYIFGPVPSRRLGLSLGVDLVPHKTCTLNCVYCECGRTTHLTLQRSTEYGPVGLIKEELKAFLAGDPKLDFITFSGSGEPTLHSDIGEVIRFLKSAYSQHQVALLTNGTLFYEPQVRKQILEADLINVSLDAVTPQTFISINRPHRGLKLSLIINGLISLRKEFEKQLWVEVFLVPGLNDSESELKKIKNILSMINPDRIQLNTLDRPGTESWVKPLDQKTLTDIAAYLYDAEIIKRCRSGYNDQVYMMDFNKRILAALKRRPCTAEDVSKFLGVQVSGVQSYLDALIANGEIKKKEMPRGVFYVART